MKRMNRFTPITKVVYFMLITLCAFLFLVSCNKKENEEPEPNVATVNIAAIQGLTKPIAGAAPVTAITETEQYTGAVTWTPAVSIRNICSRNGLHSLNYTYDKRRLFL